MRGQNLGTRLLFTGYRENKGCWDMGVWGNIIYGSFDTGGHSSLIRGAGAKNVQSVINSTPCTTACNNTPSPLNTSTDKRVAGLVSYGLSCYYSNTTLGLYAQLLDLGSHCMQLAIIRTSVFEYLILKFPGLLGHTHCVVRRKCYSRAHFLSHLPPKVRTHMRDLM